MKQAITLDQCALYKCGSKKRLAERLQIDVAELKHIPEWAGYNTWEKAKPRDGTRTIYDPYDKLKAVQRRIKRLLEQIEKPAWVYSGTKGKCHVDNARAHEGSRFMVLTDISSFYESCTRDAVYRFFRESMRTAPDVASCLADLTTYKTDDGRRIIPAGSPCSQLLAYFAYREMFAELHACAESYGCTLSLYVDDLTVSSQHPISNPKSMTKRFHKITSAYGHSLKWEKTHYFGSSQFKIVTGVALDGEGRVLVPNALGNKIKKGLENALNGDVTQYASTMGRIGAARQINANAFPEIERLLKQATA